MKSDRLNVFLRDLLRRFAALPRWLQWTLLIAMMGLGAFCYQALVPERTASGASDPFLNPTALALDVFWKFGIIVFLIYLGSLVLRKWQGGQTNRAVRQLAVLETLQLSPRRSLHLVQAGNQILLIGATDQSLALISEVTPRTETGEATAPVPATPVHAPATPAVSSSFASILSLVNTGTQEK